MATNPYFDVRIVQSEKTLMEDLVTEIIAMHGFDVVYIRKEIDNVDQVLNEIIYSTFEDATVIEMYLENNGEFSINDLSMNKFGLNFTGSAMTLSVSRRRFKEEFNNTRLEPDEGDILYIPHVKLLFEIVNVDLRDPFMSGGEHWTYTIKCEPYTMSHDKLNTTWFDEDNKTPIDNYFSKRSQENITSATFDRDIVTFDSIKYGFDVEEVNADQIDKTFDYDDVTFDNVDYLMSSTWIRKYRTAVVGEISRLNPNSKNAVIEKAGSKVIINDPKDKNPFGFI